MLVLAVVPLAASAARPDTTSPRIVAAVLQDVNRDYRADRVRVTFSERIRHARDADGTYPFSVAGYRVGSVGAANGKTIVIALAEKPSVDSAARPAVRYRRTNAKPVADRAGNQAAAQTFRRTRAHGRKPPTLPKPPEPAPPPPGQLDTDGDKYPDAQDCAPTDPAINPGAADLPDLSFVDSNCDGIDGTEAKAVFVSAFGNDAAPGTRAAPKREINAAVAIAAANDRYVLATDGSYGRVVAATGVAIYGGYDRTTWARSTSGDHRDRRCAGGSARRRRDGSPASARERAGHQRRGERVRDPRHRRLEAHPGAGRRDGRPGSHRGTGDRRSPRDRGQERRVDVRSRPSGRGWRQPRQRSERRPRRRRRRRRCRRQAGRHGPGWGPRRPGRQAGKPGQGRRGRPGRDSTVQPGSRAREAPTR